MLAVNLEEARSRHKTKAVLRHYGCAIAMLAVCGCTLACFLSNAQNGTVLTNIVGIDDVTRGLIDSGEWSKEAIVIDQEKGLLPPDPLQGGAGSAALGAGSSDGAKKKKKGSSSNESGDQDGINGVGIHGHCKLDVHIKCTSHAECGPIGGCVQWHCSNNSEVKCLTSDDCGSYGGVCTGAGYCRSNPETACSKSEDCQIYDDSQCMFGGTCQLDSSVACIQDSDCSNAEDSCSFHIKKWWEAGIDFPADDSDTGPYANWTEVQLRRKMVIALKKILYLQADMESQIPINRMLNQSIENLARRKGEILKVNVPAIRKAQKLMRQTIDDADIEHKKDSSAAGLRKDAQNLNQTIAAEDSIQDDHILRIQEDFDLINETVNSSYSILLSRMDNLWQEFNDTAVVLNETQHETTKILFNYFATTFKHAKAQLLSSLKEIEDMPSEDYYNGLREVESMFRDFKVKNERYLTQIKNDASSATRHYNDHQSPSVSDANASYYNSSNRASLITGLSSLRVLSLNVSAQETNLTALERALNSFERDFPLPSA